MVMKKDKTSKQHRNQNYHCTQKEAFEQRSLKTKFSILLFQECLY